MTTLRLPGDPAFGFGADGTLNVRFPSLPPQSLSLEELTALAAARTRFPAGCTTAQLLQALPAGGNASSWEETVAGLGKKGLLLPADLPLPANGPAFAFEAGEAEGTHLRELLYGLPWVAPLEPTELPLTAAEFLEAAATDAQQLGVGYDWCREASMRCASELAGTLAQALGKPGWLQFVPARAATSVDRIDRLYDGRARFVFLVRHALEFVDAAYRSLCLVNPMALYSAGWPSLLSGREGDYHHALATHWADFARVVHAFESRNPKRVHLLRYEQLLADPNAALERLHAFLDGSALPPAPPAGGGEQAWSGWPPQLVKRLAPIVSPGLAQLSYPPVS